MHILGFKAIFGMRPTTGELQASPGKRGRFWNAAALFNVRWCAEAVTHRSRCVETWARFHRAFGFDDGF